MASLRRLFSKQPSDSDCDRFRDLCERGAVVLNKHGAGITPYENQRVTRFREHLDHERILKNMATFVDVLEFSDRQGHNMRNESRKTLWHAILCMGLAPQPDLFDQMRDGDSVEIYSASEDRIIFPAIGRFASSASTFEDASVGAFTQSPPRATWLALLKLKFGWLKKTWRESDVTFSPLKRNGRTYAAARISHDA